MVIERERECIDCCMSVLKYYVMQALACNNTIPRIVCTLSLNHHDICKATQPQPQHNHKCKIVLPYGCQGVWERESSPTTPWLWSSTIIVMQALACTCNSCGFVALNFFKVAMVIEKERELTDHCMCSQVLCNARLACTCNSWDCVALQLSCCLRKRELTDYMTDQILCNASISMYM